MKLNINLFAIVFLALAAILYILGKGRRSGKNFATLMSFIRAIKAGLSNKTTSYCYKDICPLREPAADLDAVEQWMHDHGGYVYQESADESMEPPELDAPF